jgi:phosphatidylinositol alpha-1,6-mannosyltransferase
MHHILVTNDFPPKVGGIQSYLWELWRRLPPSSFTVLTISHPDADAFDAVQAFRVVRLPARMLVPTPCLARQVRSLASKVRAGLVIFDPAIPVGLLGPRLGLPYGVVLHGAEVSIPGKLPVTSAALAKVLRCAEVAVAAGEWVGTEAARVAAAARKPRPGASGPRILTISPGVDHTRFVPLNGAERDAVRRRLGLPLRAELVLSVGRLVPRKGIGTLLEAVALLAPSRPDLCLAIAGTGREADKLKRLAETLGPRCLMLGRVPDADLASLYGAADVFAQPTCTRWGGLEQEGFGIVFLEAAACGVPAVAGRSGGAAEAVLDGVTGLVVQDPKDPFAVASALASLLDDPAARERLGRRARDRVESGFTYDLLAAQLAEGLRGLSGIGSIPNDQPLRH